ncbi:hypothetical protein KE423_003912 [Salmonella enterica]|nr:hypothetical protein [Salmonella enterica]
MKTVISLTAIAVVASCALNFAHAENLSPADIAGYQRSMDNFDSMLSNSDQFTDVQLAHGAQQAREAAQYLHDYAHQDLKPLINAHAYKAAMVYYAPGLSSHDRVGALRDYAKTGFVQEPAEPAPVYGASKVPTPDAVAKKGPAHQPQVAPLRHDSTAKRVSLLANATQKAQQTPPAPAAVAPAAPVAQTYNVPTPKPAVVNVPQPQPYNVPPVPAAKAPVVNVPTPIAQSVPPTSAPQPAKVPQPVAQATPKIQTHDTTAKRDAAALHQTQRQQDEINSHAERFNDANNRTQTPAPTTATTTTPPAQTLTPDDVQTVNDNFATLDQRSSVNEARTASNSARIDSNTARIDHQQSEIDNNRAEARNGIAAVAAFATVPEVRDNQTVFFGAGVSDFKGVQGVAVAASANAGPAKVKFGASYAGGDTVIAAGAGFGF